uniref:Aldo/keto reductase n=1 Tax=Rhodopseudomonas palustris (strain DX-1) TaxID=652103 RepID=E6VFJ0_RHOPX
MEDCDAWVMQKLKREAQEEADARAAKVAHVVLAATTAAPQISAAIVKAARGPSALAPYQLAEAIRLAKQLVTDLEIAQLALGWKPEPTEPRKASR